MSLKGIGPGLAKQIRHLLPPDPGAGTGRPGVQPPPAAPPPRPSGGSPVDRPKTAKTASKPYAPREHSPAWSLLLGLRLLSARSPASAASKASLCDELQQPSYQVPPSSLPLSLPLFLSPSFHTLCFLALTSFFSLSVCLSLSLSLSPFPPAGPVSGPHSGSEVGRHAAAAADPRPGGARR
jgi:hypothetical protein